MKRELLRIICRNSDILFFNKLTLNKLNIIKGGGNRKLKVKYNEHTYIFEELELNDNHFILFSQDESNECMSIVISTEDNIAEIHGISNFKGCLIDTNNNIGSHLLKITLKMLKNYSDKLKINKITLKDNSIKNCGSDKIKLTKMLILLTGHTWYGKKTSGSFRPNDNVTNNIDKNKNKHYEKNIKIMDKLTISDINLVKYIKITKKEQLIKQVEDAIKNSPKMLLTDFINIFLKNYDKTCKYFNMFYEKLYTDIGLTDFQGNSFILIL
jgi:hypothetical protein